MSSIGENVDRSQTAGECNLDMAMEESLKKMQQDQCESCNEFIRALIDGKEGIESFIDSAVSADGRGHFLSSYDGEENEEGDYFIYRIN